MGWSSGSRLFSDVISTISDNVKDDDARREIYRDLITAFEDMDCDTLSECMGEDAVFDEIFREMNPDFFDEED